MMRNTIPFSAIQHEKLISQRKSNGRNLINLFPTHGEFASFIMIIIIIYVINQNEEK